MARTYFYAAPDDQAAIREYIDSMSLSVYPAQSNVLGKWSKNNDIGGYITFLSADQLHPYRAAGDKLLQRSIAHVLDPLIWWMPSRLMDHDGDRYIIQGCIEYDFPFSKEREEEHRKGTSYFGKLQRWIRKNWPNQKKGGIAYGPHAQRLVQYEGYLARGLPPNIKVEYVKI